MNILYVKIQISYCLSNNQKICIENWHLLDLYQVLKSLEDQKLINAVIKDTNICQNYLNETEKFTMSNGQVWKILRELDCHSVNVKHYLKCKMCNEKETYVGKTIEDNAEKFKVRIN